MENIGPEKKKGIRNRFSFALTAINTSALPEKKAHRGVLLKERFLRIVWKAVPVCGQLPDANIFPKIQ
jgi:hypothetical protein